MYVGGLENHPDLIESWAKLATLWGTRAEVVRVVRDPQLLSAAFHREGLRFPRIASQATDRSASRWLRKPRRSGGGRGIMFWNPGDPLDPEKEYLQEYVAGRSLSGAWVADDQTVHLLGVTKQEIGDQGNGARGFQYSGSLGPLPLGESEQQEWIRIGQCLHGTLGLRGLFGVDAVHTEAGLYVIEVNPRYTASMELIERATECSLVGLHRDACEPGRRLHLPAAGTGPQQPQLGEPREEAGDKRQVGAIDSPCRKIESPHAGATHRLHGKRIVYATRTVRVGAKLSQAWWQRTREAAEPSPGTSPCNPHCDQTAERPGEPTWFPPLADIPKAESIFEPQEPICTVFATGCCEDEVRAALAKASAEIDLELDRQTPD
jgi:predicted ATP-grasp superfamily ATP-dependent carboligase